MNQANAFPWDWLWKILGIGAGLWLLANTWQLWLLVLSALILTAAMLPAARWGDRLRVPRIITVSAIYLVVALILWLLGWFLVPVLVEQGSQFANELPLIVGNIKRWLGDLSSLGGEAIIPLPTVESLDENWEKIVPGLIEKTLRATAGVLGGVLGLLVILFIAAYALVDAERISRGLLALVPADRRPRVAALAEPVLQRMGGYVRGQIVASGCVGIILTAGLWILEVPYAVLIGGLAAVLNVIPFLGATLASIVGVLTALNLSVSLAICGPPFSSGERTSSRENSWYLNWSGWPQASIRWPSC